MRAELNLEAIRSLSLIHRPRRIVSQAPAFAQRVLDVNHPRFIGLVRDQISFLLAVVIMSLKSAIDHTYEKNRFTPVIVVNGYQRRQIHRKRDEPFFSGLEAFDKRLTCIGVTINYGE